MLLPKEKVNSLLRVLHERQPLSQEIEQQLEKMLLPVPVPKYTILVKEGDPCDYIYFILEGAFRSYREMDGKDITTWISTENEFITAISAYFQKVPALKNVEALEDSFLLAIHRDDLQVLIRKYPEMNNVLRIFYEEYYLAAEERAYVARIRDAEGKYKRLLETYPDLIKRLPLKYIASYLGMTLETLSRIRSRMTKQSAV
jgi:CRP-like cAMP-binding protein